MSVCEKSPWKIAVSPTIKRHELPWTPIKTNPLGPQYVGGEGFL